MRKSALHSPRRDFGSVLCYVSSYLLMSVTVNCPQVADARLRAQVSQAVESAVKRWRPSFEAWRLALFRNQSGEAWELAIAGPRFRKIFTLYGPADDLPGLVTAYLDAIMASVP